MRPPVDWTEQDVLELIRNKQEEHLELEFKRADSLKASDGAKKEISKDVSAFANSAGGTIVYGIAESDPEPHCAETLSPVDPALFSKETLGQVINSRIRPRVAGVIINPVLLSGSHAGKYVYVVCIPQSETAHQASDHRYYRRYNFESVPMEDYEVRQTMGRASRAAYKVEMRYSQASEREGLKFFKLSCVIENVSELVGRDVSAVVFLPAHLIVQLDDYRVQIEGAAYSRIPGTWEVSSHEQRTAIDIHPVTPYQIFFHRELKLLLSMPSSELRMFVRVFDQFGLAHTSRILVETPSLGRFTGEELPSAGPVRRPNISNF